MGPGEYSENKLTPNPYDNNYPYPYWEQNWYSGEWEEAEEYDVIKECFVVTKTTTGGLFYISMGKPWSEYVRIIKPAYNQPKIIQYDTSALPRGYYEEFPFKDKYPLKWEPALTNHCAEKILNGYILIIAYEHRSIFS